MKPSSESMNESGFESGNHTISFNEADKVARTGIMMLIKREQENDFGDRTDGRKEFFSFRILEKKVSSITKGFSDSSHFLGSKA